MSHEKNRYQKKKYHSSSQLSEEGRFLPGTLLGDRYRIISLLGAGVVGKLHAWLEGGGKSPNEQVATERLTKMLKKSF